MTQRTIAAALGLALAAAVGSLPAQTASTGGAHPSASTGPIGSKSSEAKPAPTRQADAKPAGSKAAAAKQPDARSDPATAEVRQRVESKFPGADIRHVGKAPYLGLYEVLLDGQMIYVDPKVSVVFVGNLFDPDKRVNVTQERMQELTAVDWKELPLDLAIKTVRGNGARKVAIFSDVDCPYCKRLETELKDVDNLTIYTFLFPIDALHPDARRKSKLIWCAGDRKQSYDDWMIKGTAPASDVNCDDPVERIVALGEKFRIQATPTLIFADGRIVPGALPKAQLEANLARADAAAVKKRN